MNRCLVYYHMPFEMRDGLLYSNPVIGIFLDSLSLHFKKIIVVGHIARKNRDRLTHNINMQNGLVEFESLGPEGKVWDFIIRRIQLRVALKNRVNDFDVLVLRLPSPKSYIIWNYLGRPSKVIYLFVGNPLFTNGVSYSSKLELAIRKYRSKKNIEGLRFILDYSKVLAFANSKELCMTWSEILETSSINYLITSSLRSFQILDNKKSDNQNDKFRVLFVGRIAKDKGIAQLLEAIKVIRDNGCELFEFTFVGPIEGFDVTKRIKELKLTEIVDYIGPVAFGHELLKIYRKADVYILPSFHEGMPHTVWEAFSQQTPVIVTKVGGLRDNFRHLEDVIFIEPYSVSDIVNALYLIEKDETLRNKLVANGLSYVKFATAERQALEMYNAYIKFFKQP